MMAIYERNLAESLSVVHGIRDYATVTEECEEIIVKGPEAVGISTYAATITKLSGALNDLQSANLQTFFKVIEKATMLVKKGSAQLKDYLRKLLAQAFKPIDAGEYLAKDIRMPVIKSQEMALLRQLYEVFDSQPQLDRREVDKIYFEISSRFIQASLGSLETKCHPPATPPTPSVAQAISMMSNTVGGPGGSNAAGPSGTGPSNASLINISKAPPYERGSNTIIKYSDALCLLLTAEVENSARLFPDMKEMQTFYFESVCANAVTGYVKICEEINAHVKTHLATDAMLAFEVIEATGHLINTIQMVLKRVPTALSASMQSVQETTHQVFTDFIKYIEVRVQNIVSLPNDNGVCDVTIEVMSRMKRFADYKNSALVSISTMTPGSWISSNPRPSWYTTFTSSGAAPAAAAGNPVELLSSYFSDAIDALFVCLEMKAKATQKRNTQAGFFLLNNLTLIERYVTKSDIYMILGSTGSDRIEKLRKRGLNLFLEGYVFFFLPCLITNCFLAGRVPRPYLWTSRLSKAARPLRQESPHSVQRIVKQSKKNFEHSMRNSIPLSRHTKAIISQTKLCDSYSLKKLHLFLLSTIDSTTSIVVAIFRNMLIRLVYLNAAPSIC